MHIYVNYFNRLRFLAHKIAKTVVFLDNLRTITEERNMETRQMTQFYHLLFSF